MKDNIKTYTITYDNDLAECIFEVDLNQFTDYDANTLLDFYGWEAYGENPIEVLLKYYTLDCIRVYLRESSDVDAIHRFFGEQEGHAPIDGSVGITLIDVWVDFFEIDNLNIKIK